MLCKRDALDIYLGGLERYTIYRFTYIYIILVYQVLYDRLHINAVSLQMINMRFKFMDKYRLGPFHGVDQTVWCSNIIGR